MGVLAKVGVRAWRVSWFFRKVGTAISRVSGKGEGRGVGLRTESRGPRRRPSGVPGKCSSSLGSGKTEEKKACQYVLAGEGGHRGAITSGRGAHGPCPRPPLSGLNQLVLLSGAMDSRLSWYLSGKASPWGINSKGG